MAAINTPTRRCTKCGETKPSDEATKRYTELIARHDAFFFIELPMCQLMFSAEIVATQHVAEMQRCMEQRKMAEENARYHEELVKLYQMNGSHEPCPTKTKE